MASSIARATDLFGDAWTALIMRDLRAGVTRFDDLLEDLGIPRKVLAARLSRLVEEDVLVRAIPGAAPVSTTARPTRAGSSTRYCSP